jgi:hypothetical protein
MQKIPEKREKRGNNPNEKMDGNSLFRMRDTVQTPERLIPSAQFPPARFKSVSPAKYVICWLSLLWGG